MAFVKSVHFFLRKKLFPIKTHIYNYGILSVHHNNGEEGID